MSDATPRHHAAPPATPHHPPRRTTRLTLSFCTALVQVLSSALAAVERVEARIAHSACWPLETLDQDLQQWVLDFGHIQTDAIDIRRQVMDGVAEADTPGADPAAAARLFGVAAGAEGATAVVQYLQWHVENLRITLTEADDGG